MSLQPSFQSSPMLSSIAQCQFSSQVKNFIKNNTNNAPDSGCPPRMAPTGQAQGVRNRLLPAHQAAGQISQSPLVCSSQGLKKFPRSRAGSLSASGRGARATAWSWLLFHSPAHSPSRGPTKAWLPTHHTWKALKSEYEARRVR